MNNEYYLYIPGFALNLYIGKSLILHIFKNKLSHKIEYSPDIKIEWVEDSIPLTKKEYKTALYFFGTNK